MSKKLKSKEFRLSFQVLLRLFIFAIVFISLISYFSGSNGSTLGAASFLPDTAPYVSSLADKVWSGLPESSRHTLSNLDNLPITNFITDKTSGLQKSLEGFPQKQLKDIQVGIIKTVSDELIKKVAE